MQLTLLNDPMERRALPADPSVSGTDAIVALAMAPSIAAAHLGAHPVAPTVPMPSAPGTSPATTSVVSAPSGLTTRQFVQADDAAHLHLVVTLITRGHSTLPAIDAAVAQHLIDYPEDRRFGATFRQADYYTTCAEVLHFVVTHAPTAGSRLARSVATPTGTAWAQMARGTDAWRDGFADACRENEIFRSALDFVAHHGPVTPREFVAHISARYATATGRRDGVLGVGAGPRRGQSSCSLLLTAGLLAKQGQLLVATTAGRSLGTYLRQIAIPARVAAGTLPPSALPRTRVPVSFTAADLDRNRLPLPVNDPLRRPGDSPAQLQRRQERFTLQKLAHANATHRAAFVHLHALLRTHQQPASMTRFVDLYTWAGKDFLFFEIKSVSATNFKAQAMMAGAQLVRYRRLHQQPGARGAMVFTGHGPADEEALQHLVAADQRLAILWLDLAEGTLCGSPEALALLGPFAGLATP